MAAEPKKSAEATDAKCVDDAVKKIPAGDIKGAITLLLDVISKTPTPYIREFERDGTRYVRFWDMQEFVHFVSDKERPVTQKVVWLPAAYPRAFYYLGFIHVKLNDPMKAIGFLETGLQIEQHPLFLIERGKALSELHRHDEALASYQKVFELERISAQIRAVAVRGTGFQLIELGQLDQAEEAFEQSLKLDPGNHIATNELRYIQSLRRDGQKAPKQTVVSNQTTMICAICGKPLKERAKVTNIDGRVVYRCDECAAKLPATGGTPGLPAASSAMTVTMEKPAESPRRWWHFFRR